MEKILNEIKIVIESDNQASALSSFLTKENKKKLEELRPGNFSWKQRMFDILHSIKDKQKCSVCGKELDFLQRGFGYPEVCRSCACSRAAKKRELDPRCRDKARETKVKKYGDPNYNNRKAARETCIKKYGGPAGTSSKEVIEKRKKTTLAKYGVEHTTQTEQQKEATKKTCLKMYGAEHIYSSKQFREKAKIVCLEKYGSATYNNPNKQRRSRAQSFYEKLIKSNRLAGLVEPMFEAEDYTVNDSTYRWKCSKCGYEFNSDIDDGKIPSCKKCFPPLSGTSRFEEEVADFVISLGTKVERNSRKIISPAELDISVPEAKMAIECNGVYWHSELNGCSPGYHLSKTVACENIGWQLIHVFESEWVYKKEIVKSVLSAKFGKLSNSIGARKCNVIVYTGNELSDFFEENHIQGNVNSQFAISLETEGKIVAACSFGRPRFNKKYDYELLRFCCAMNTFVPGGLSRIISKFREIEPESKLLSYCDRRWSVGSGYLTSGFSLVRKTPPCYWYVENDAHLSHRSKYMKKHLAKTIPNFDPTLTEWQNMQLAGYDRVWDCGNFVFELV